MAQLRLPPSRNAATLWVLALVMCSLLGAFAHTRLGYSWPASSGHTLGNDDAYISYRYAKNLFDGSGLVFNPGEKVEGYSNFLYVLLVTPGFLFTDNVYFFSVAINGALLSLTILMFSQFLSRTLDASSALAGALLLAINPWLWAGAATGLETVLVLTVTTATWIAVETFLSTAKQRHLIGTLVLCVVSVLSRVDGFVLPVAVVLYALLKGNKKLAIGVCVTLLATGIAYTAFRYGYYHDVIANTYYNKVAGNLWPRLRFGARYLLENTVRTGLWIPALVLVWALLTSIRKGTFRQSLNFPLLFLPLWCSYLVWIGGDVYFERFLIALFPMAIYVVLKHGPRIRAIPRVAVVSCLVLFQTGFAFTDGRFDYSSSRYDGWELTGRFLGQTYPGATLAVDAAGKLAFFSNLKTIDMLGLSDKHIGKMKVDNKYFRPGHTKFDPTYVLSLEPDLIAAWTASNLDLDCGITRERYQQGYELYYLVNLTRDDRHPDNIVVVKDKPVEQVVGLVENGYDYAILKRIVK